MLCSKVFGKRFVQKFWKTFCSKVLATFANNLCLTLLLDPALDEQMTAMTSFQED